tara:strand:- start:9 stop:281 length:273 start_codon:yes stop_codon:yes gene_type:complete
LIFIFDDFVVEETGSVAQKTFVTSDLATAAFLHMKGLKLIKAESSANGRFMFEFDDSDGSAISLAYDFINSECSKFDNHIRLLKKMIYKK